MKDTIKLCLSIFFLLAAIIFFSAKKRPLVIKETQTTVVQKIERNVEQFSNPINQTLIISSDQSLRSPIEDEGALVTYGTYHNAIDIVIPDKTPVYASKDGIVKTVYPSFYNGERWQGHPIYGGLIEIEHNDRSSTLYAHLSFTEVKEGDEVLRGQEIGWSGGVKGRRGSGNSTGPHLHFSILINIEDFLEEQN